MNEFSYGPIIKNILRYESMLYLKIKNVRKQLIQKHSDGCTHMDKQGLLKILGTHSTLSVRKI